MCGGEKKREKKRKKRRRKKIKRKRKRKKVLWNVLEFGGSGREKRGKKD